MPPSPLYCFDTPPLPPFYFADDILMLPPCFFASFFAIAYAFLLFAIFTPLRFLLLFCCLHNHSLLPRRVDICRTLR